jgi:hypothetical protein
MMTGRVHSMFEPTRRLVMGARQALGELAGVSG